MFLRLGRKIRRQIQSWLRGDRIRTSAAERHWLELKPPCLTYWQGERIEVLGRQEQISPHGASLRFECRTPRGIENLTVYPGDLHQAPRFEWSSLDHAAGINDAEADC